MGARDLSACISGHLDSSAGTTAGAYRGADLVVGFDGSRPAQRALDAAVQIVYQRHGTLEIVYVSQEPAPTAMSPEPMTEGDGIGNETARQLSVRVRALLEGTTGRTS